MNITSHIRPMRAELAIATVAVGVCAGTVIALGPTSQIQILATSSQPWAQGPATPWDPGCWGPFSWNTGGCQWSPSTGTNGQWVPDPFNGGGTNPGNGMGPGMMGPR